MEFDLSQTGSTRSLLVRRRLGRTINLSRSRKTRRGDYQKVKPWGEGEEQYAGRERLRALQRNARRQWMGALGAGRTGRKRV